MKFDFLKNIYFYVCAIEYEGKKIQVFKEKKSLTSVFFVEENGELSLLDPDDALKLSKHFDIKTKKYIEKTSNYRKVTMPQLVEGPLPTENGDVGYFKEYDIDGFTYKTSDEKTLNIPFKIRVEEGTTENKSICVDDYIEASKTAVLAQIGTYEKIGLNPEEIVARFKDEPLAINFYNFMCASGYCYARKTVLDDIHINNIYISTNGIETFAEIGGNFLKEEKKDLVNVIRHELNHINADKMNMTGFNSYARNISVFCALNEAITEMLVYAEGKEVMKYHNYSEIIKILEPSVPDKKVCYLSYFKNDLDGFIKSYTDYYHCSENDVLEFFVKLDCYLADLSETEPLFSNIKDECLKTVIQFRLNKMFYENQDFFEGFDKISNEDIKVLDGIYIESKLLEVLEGAKIEFIKDYVLGRLSFEKKDGIIIFENGIKCDEKQFNELCEMYSIDVKKIQNTKSQIGKVNGLVEYVRNSRLYKDQERILRLDNLSFDELIVLMSSVDSEQSFNPYLTAIVKRDLNKKQIKQLIFQMNRYTCKQFVNSIMCGLDARSYKNFISKVDKECIDYAFGREAKSFVKILLSNVKDEELYNYIVKKSTMKFKTFSALKGRINYEILTEGTKDMISACKLDAVNYACSQYRKYGSNLFMVDNDYLSLIATKKDDKIVLKEEVVFSYLINVDEENIDTLTEITEKLPELLKTIKVKGQKSEKQIIPSKAISDLMELIGEKKEETHNEQRIEMPIGKEEREEATFE